MPQLMPLYWMYSVLMVFFILLMLIDLYYFKDKEIKMVKIDNLYKEKNTLFLW